MKLDEQLQKWFIIVGVIVIAVIMGLLIWEIHKQTISAPPPTPETGVKFLSC